MSKIYHKIVDGTGTLLKIVEGTNFVVSDAVADATSVQHKGLCSEPEFVCLPTSQSCAEEAEVEEIEIDVEEVDVKRQKWQPSSECLKQIYAGFPTTRCKRGSLTKLTDKQKMAYRRKKYRDRQCLTIKALDVKAVSYECTISDYSAKVIALAEELRIKNSELDTLKSQFVGKMPDAIEVVTQKYKLQVNMMAEDNIKVRDLNIELTNENTRLQHIINAYHHTEFQQ